MKIAEINYTNNNHLNHNRYHSPDNNISRGMRINQKIRQRVKDVAHYILENKCTVRDAAKKFNISKSTVHVDMTERLKLVDPVLFKKVRDHLDYNYNVRHLRGGEATKAYYINKRVN